MGGIKPVCVAAEDIQMENGCRLIFAMGQEKKARSLQEKGGKMRIDKFIERVELKWCYNCARYKEKYKKKWEIVCEENKRLNAMPFHRDIILNHIDRATGECGNFKRAK